MTAIQTYPIHTPATAGLHCAGMSLRIGSPRYWADFTSPNMRRNLEGKDLTKEASR